MRTSILLTGGAGYIGSHTAFQLLEKYKTDFDLVIIDNLCNSSFENIQAVQTEFNIQISFYPINLCDISLLKNIFSQHNIEFVIHFAGLKAVGESNEIPLSYYQNNLISTMNLLQTMQEYNCKNIIFSSSATVYGLPQYMPYDENHPLSATNPYGMTKLMIEQILNDIYKSPNNNINITILRYFNPISCHPKGILKENPKGRPNNLFPIVSRVYQKNRDIPFLTIFGNDYETKDGTGVRDYIHVVDLANAHVSAIQQMINYKGETETEAKYKVYNVGTGNGYSVLEMINMFKEISGEEIPYEIKERRKGDLAVCYADPTKIRNDLGWEPIYGLREMVEHEINRINSEK